MAAVVVQVMSDFNPEVFENPMFSDVMSVRLRRLGGPNLFAQGRKPIVIAVVATAKQRMRHPGSILCPPPDIALKCIC